MSAAKSPGLGRHVVSETSLHRFPQAPICGSLIGSHHCEAEGISARGSHREVRRQHGIALK